jgi:outer membrane protein assembly factor BamB
MVKTHRTARLLALTGLWVACALLFVVTPADGQKGKKQPPADPSKSGTVIWSALRLIENSDLQQYILLSQRCIDDKAWNDAVTALQTVLDNKEDFYVKVKHRDPQTGEEKERSASVKLEANNMIGTMALEGQNTYDIRFGGQARQMLDEAKKKGDLRQLAEVAQRFMHTKAGAEANDILATSLLDRGQFFSAALRFERLMEANPERIKLSDLTLFKAALAFRRAGDVKRSDETMKKLEVRVAKQGGLRINDQLVAMGALHEVINNIPRPQLNNPHDCPMVGLTLARTGQAKGSPPLLDDVLFRRPTNQDKSDFGDEIDRGKGAQTWLDRALSPGDNPFINSNPIMPGAFPIAAAGMLIYRTPLDVRAVHIRDVKNANGEIEAKAGQIAWKSTDLDGSLAVLLDDTNLANTVENWLNGTYRPSGFLNLLYENSMVGAVSTDHRLVYVVDDLAVPAPPGVHLPHIWNSQQIGDKVKPLIMSNVLSAFDLHSGKIAFRLGGDPTKNDDFMGSHFLGTPVNIGGKLYVLNEKNNGQLRLVTLEVHLKKDDDKDRWIVTPSFQNLGTVEQQYKITHDISRRATTVHMAYGEGILVCPTNAGSVLGVDLMSRSLAWAYHYRQSAPHPQSVIPLNQGLPNPNRVMSLSYSNWKVSPPFIHDGKVVFTAPDGVSIHCINLRDGTPVWTSRQQDHDLFLAGVFNDKLLVIGKHSARALKLSDGTSLWTQSLGDMPSGQGVASKNIYYLPLRKGDIIALDMEQGAIKARIPSNSKGGAAPGNLVFYEGAVLTQTAREIIAFPQLTHKLDLADAAVQADPKNPEKILARGELLLADGQVRKAVDDLSDVLAKVPNGNLTPRARSKLYDALTNLLQVDFNAASPRYLEKYRELCDVPNNVMETHQRQAKFLRILGQGRESQGNLVEAFGAYREFGSLPIFKQEGIPSLEDPTQKIPANAWLRGRVMAMLATATPAQLKPLEEKIDQEWKVVEAKGDVDAIRSFVGIFDVPFPVGRESRLRLADALIEKGERASFLEAELNLQQLRASKYRDVPEVGGRALEALARLEWKKGGEEAGKLSVAYYRDLAREFPKAVVRDAKTGTDFLNELADQKRNLLPYLEEPTSPWGKADIKHRELLPDKVPVGLEGVVIQPMGEMTPFLKQHRLILYVVNRQEPVVSLVDMTTNKVRWTQNLGNVSTNYQFFQHLHDLGQRNMAYHPNARFRFFQGTGHLAVFQVGTMAYALDLDGAKILWQYNLLDIPTDAGAGATQVMPDAEGTLFLTITNQFNQVTTRKRVGQVGVVRPSYVALTTQKGLIVVDPLRVHPDGKSPQILWSKMNIAPQTEIFGDDDYIYLVDTSADGTTGAGRAVRASDGSPAKVTDFGHLYRYRVRVRGRNILSADPAGGKLTLRYYDVLAGKDIWKQEFDQGSDVLKTEDPNLTGVIEPDGKMTVVDLRTFKVVLTANVKQGRVGDDDLKNLKEPLLLRDNDRYYVALNQPIDSKVMGGVVTPNFGNGLRCHLVNGWLLAFDHKGEFLWHVYERMKNQMIVLEQFHHLPLLLFSSRYTEMSQAGVGTQRMVSWTVSINKNNGKVIFWPLDPRPSNGIAQFYAFRLDLKNGTIDLIGRLSTVQHFVDDGRNPGGGDGGGAQPPAKGQPGPMGPGVLPGQPPPPPGIRLEFPPNGPGNRPMLRPRQLLPVERK